MGWGCSGGHVAMQMTRDKRTIQDTALTFSLVENRTAPSSVECSHCWQIAAWLPFVCIDGNTVTLVDNIEVDQVFTHIDLTVTMVPMNSTSIMSVVGWRRAGRWRRPGGASRLGACLGAEGVGASVRPSSGLGASGVLLNSVTPPFTVLIWGGGTGSVFANPFKRWACDGSVPPFLCVPPCSPP
jgi:hypothetical protein